MKTKSSDYKIYATSHAAWDGMFASISSAKKSIYWEVYVFVDDEVGVNFFNKLEQKAKEGLDVKLVIDYLGSFWLSRKRIKSLRESGIDLQLFNIRKHKYRGIWKQLWTRTHRKILVVDETTGFIGGVNIQKEMKDWLDIHMRVSGKIVHSLSRSFAKSYLISGGKRSKVKHLLRYKARAKHHKLKFVYDDAHNKKSTVKKIYIEALTKARERVILFSPYYFPDKDFVHALWQARKRGVKIDLLVPLRTDIRIATYAAYAWFGIIRKLGVNIHQTKQMMHGKGIIVDDNWAMIGSSNLTQDSFFDHYEANISFENKKVIKKLTKTLKNWIKKATPLTDKIWQKRGKMQKTKEWIGMTLYSFWHRRRL